MKSETRFFLLSGSLLMALAVIFGAFGSHGLQGMLTPERYDTYLIAVRYHFYHALGLLLVGAASFHLSNKWIRRSGYALLAGVLIFSGSLYLLTLLDLSWLGAVTPIGGLAMILGWVFLFVAILKKE